MIIFHGNLAVHGGAVGRLDPFGLSALLALVQLAGGQGGRRIRGAGGAVARSG